MINIAVNLEYDGSHFSGFQKQVNERTIQGELELALSKFANQDIQIIAAGRTDTGVHALNQVINFTTTAKREINGWVRGVNALLPKDIAIKNATLVPDNFNARFDAISRTYYYYLQVRKERTSILNGKVGWYHANLDIDKMQLACEILIGEHDFSSFRAANCQAKTAIRNMLECKLQLCDNNFLYEENNQKLIRFKFTANAFLYHMVRNIVGALIYVGNGKISVEEFKQLLLAKDRTIAPPTFMPDGLYLAQVKYQTPLFSN